MKLDVSPVKIALAAAGLIVSLATLWAAQSANDLATEAQRAGASAEIWRQHDNLTSLWATEPLVHTHFLGQEVASPVDPAVIGVAAETVLDVFDVIEDHWSRAGHDPTGWEAWMNDYFVSSQELRTFFVDRRDWYPNLEEVECDGVTSCRVDLNGDGTFE